MFSFRPAVVVLFVSAVAFSANAADPIVKPAPTPMPAAGPTVAAAQAFCGDVPDKAEALIKRYSESDKLKQVYKSQDFVAYGDDEKNPTVMYTFTTPDNLAHPAAVCRQIVQEGDALVVKMEIVCDGPADDCSKLRNDFNVLTARMQLDVDQKIKASKQ